MICRHCRTRPGSFHCQRCDRHIGRSRSHIITATGQVWCARCILYHGEDQRPLLFASYAYARWRRDYPREVA